MVGRPQRGGEVMQTLRPLRPAQWGEGWDEGLKPCLDLPQIQRLIRIAEAGFEFGEGSLLFVRDLAHTQKTT
jgi:hypothetical protein